MSTSEEISERIISVQLRRNHTEGELLQEWSVDTHGANTSTGVLWSLTVRPWLVTAIEEGLPQENLALLNLDNQVERSDVKISPGDTLRFAIRLYSNDEEEE